MAHLRQHADATLVELRDHLVGRQYPAVSLATRSTLLQTLGWGRKKTRHAIERDTERVRVLRGAFVEALTAYDVTHFRFLDETSWIASYDAKAGLPTAATISTVAETALSRQSEIRQKTGLQATADSSLFGCFCASN